MQLLSKIKTFFNTHFRPVKKSFNDVAFGWEYASVDTFAMMAINSINYKDYEVELRFFIGDILSLKMSYGKNYPGLYSITLLGITIQYSNFKGRK